MRFSRWWSWFLGLFQEGASPTQHPLKTPMPVESALVLVLETVELSHTGVEHFLEAPQDDERHTAEIPLDWMQEQTTYTSI